jgi:3-oxoisoapionate decarboxylase
MKIGISTYTYTWAIGVPGYPEVESPMSAVDLLKTAKKQGISVVQLCDNLSLHKLSLVELEKIRKTAEDFGIILEVGTRGVEPEHLRRYLDIAQFLSSKILRIILQKNDNYVHVDEAYELIKKVLPEFEDKRIYIAIENHERHRVEELVFLIKKLDSPYVGICLDTVNSFGALEGPEYVIQTLAPYTINLHFKDFEIKRLDHKMGFGVTGTPAGSGMLDIKFVVNELDKYGKDPNVILELWTPFSGTVEETIEKESKWANKSIEFLKEYKWRR